MNNTTCNDHFNTDIGKMEITANDSAITSIYFVEKALPANPNHLTRLAIEQLSEYFVGNRMEFDLPLDARGTQFQQRVWQALSTIAYGATCSYRDIANKISNPNAVRAVGSANGKNPMTIVVPCHRIIGADGSLTGYASGVERKSWLLKHEAMISVKQKFR